MFKKITPTNIWNGWKTAFNRFPVPLTCAYGVAIIGLCYISLEDLSDLWWSNKTLLILILGTFIYVLPIIYSEQKSRNTRAIAQGIATAFLLLYYQFGLPDDYVGAGNSWIFQYIFLILTAIVSLSWFAFDLRKNTDNLKVWEYNRQVWTNLCITFFFGLIVFLGVAAGLLAIDNLFGVNIDARWYARIWVLVAAVFAPTFFLYHFPKDSEKIKVPKEVPHFVNILAKYILAPLVVGYFLILYTYTGNIMITWDWPKNLVTWLVIGFLCTGIFTYGLWTPFFEGRVEKYRRLFWVAFIPQVWVLFCAIGIRIAQYSWTENRYTVVLFGLWLLGVALYFIIHKKAQLKYLLASISIILFLCQFGPWSIYDVSKRAQQNRLSDYFVMHNITGPIAKEDQQKIPAEDQKQMSSIIRYLYERHGKDVVLASLPLTEAQLKAVDFDLWNIPNELVDALGLRYFSRWDNSDSFENYFNITTKYNTSRDVSGFDRQIRHHINSEPGDYNFKEADWISFFKAETGALKIYKDRVIVAEFDVSPFVDDLRKKHQANELVLEAEASDHWNKDQTVLDPDRLAAVYENEAIKVKVFFSNLSFRNNKLDYAHLEIFVTEK